METNLESIQTLRWNLNGTFSQRSNSHSMHLPQHHNPPSTISRATRIAHVTCPTEDLPLQAQLNCKADKLAERLFQQSPMMEHTIVPLLPTAGCQLHLAHGTTTHDIKRELSLARTVYSPTKDTQQRLCHII